MKTIIQKPIPNLDTVATLFAVWHASKRPGERVPESLWQQAAALRGNYKIIYMIKALKTNATQYNQNCPPSVSIKPKKPKKSTPKKSAKVDAFIEVPVNRVASSSLGSITFIRSDDPTATVNLSSSD